MTFICESACYTCFHTITTKLLSQTVNPMWLLQLSHILLSPVFDLIFENFLQSSNNFLPLRCNMTATRGGSILHTAPVLLLWKALMLIVYATRVWLTVLNKAPHCVGWFSFCQSDPHYCIPLSLWKETLSGDGYSHGDIFIRHHKAQNISCLPAFNLSLKSQIKVKAMNGRMETWSWFRG